MHRLKLIGLCLISSMVCAEEPQLNVRRLAVIDEVVKEGIARGRMPGCVVLVGYRGNTEFLKAYGHRQLKPEPLPMTIDTLFDLASLTKPVATATSIMQLVEQGKVDLQAPVTTYLPEFGQNGKSAITVQQLLTHQSGLLPDNSLSDYQEGPTAAFRKIDELGLRAMPGKEFIYSDVGFIVLGRVVQAVSGHDLHEYTQTHLFQPMKMQHTGYLPSEELRVTAAVTQQRDGEWMRGDVHDPRAYLLEGIAGHAGLFSTASDLARFANMLLNEGSLDGVPVMKPETVRLMRRPVPVSSGLRTLGWDMRTGYSSNRGDLMGAAAFGHGGFTGTGMWIDPEQQLFVIFLSNRVHPDGKGSVNSLIGRIGTIAAAAVPE